jgi:hypothetical protein
VVQNRGLPSDVATVNEWYLLRPTRTRSSVVSHTTTIGKPDKTSLLFIGHIGDNWLVTDHDIRTARHNTGRVKVLLPAYVALSVAAIFKATISTQEKTITAWSLSVPTCSISQNGIDFNVASSMLGSVSRQFFLTTST